MFTTSRGSLYWEDKRLTMFTTSRGSLYWEDKRLTMLQLQEVVYTEKIKD